MKKISLIAAITVLTSFAYAQNRSIEFDHSEWKTLLAKAKKENKLIFVDCYTTWCGPCKFMAKTVFTNDTVADFYNTNFVNAKIDMEKGEGLKLAKQYGIKAYPTMLYVNGDGEQIHRTCGSSYAQDFIAAGKDAMDPEKQMASYARKFKKGSADASLAYTYFGLLDNACQKYESELENYFFKQKETEYTSRGSWNLIKTYVNTYDSKIYQHLEKNKAAYAALYSVDSVEDKINTVYKIRLNTAMFDKDKQVYADLKAKYKLLGNKETEKVLAFSDLNMLFQEKNWTAFAPAMNEYMKKYNDLDAGRINRYAWSVYEEVNDPVILENAAVWIKRAIELQNIYSFNDTYAWILFKLGKKEEARMIAEKAIALAKQNNEDHTETDELLKKIATIE
ncbi:MAG: thioredoxin domain-containing protein [Bacteroidota bacterium]|nr:thioredoxin domain-containing protein [Bacteroidota bacterium]